MQSSPLPVIKSRIVPQAAGFKANREAYQALIDRLRDALKYSVAGGGDAHVKRHHKRGKMLVRDRIDLLVDPFTPFLELSPLAAWGMYDNEVPGAGNGAKSPTDNAGSARRSSIKRR